jgi:adenine-specific DNA-methyltransferase
MDLLHYFNQDNNLGAGIRQFFTEQLNLKLLTPTEKGLPKTSVFSGIEEEKLSDVDSIYFGGKLSDKTFEEEEGDETSFEETEKELAQGKYASILVFGVELNTPAPTRSRLAEITRWLNRKSLGVPVVVVFRYNGLLAFANGERMQYVNAKREGEKVGKVAVLRDIDVTKPHTGHLQILGQLKITKSGKGKIDTFESLYQFWQEVFSVNLLNKKFYQELSAWYFWAIKHVVFPGQPTELQAYEKGKGLDDLIQEHKATNVIRMLTRLLFVWFIKEKKLIPEELFDLKTLQKDILKNISPFHETGLYVEANKESIYYKAILQNLFFATLNCPIEGDALDTRKRGFRGDGYGTHRGIDWLMRYKKHFKDPEAFLTLVNSTVPFLNGGLFECLDDKTQNLYTDGFSDQMTKGEQLIVPDYLFFGTEEEEDLSKIVGISDKKYKNAAVKGLVNILKSYKFTITENTPIEEDVALDPELLGKVFENLLASYNPETKTTARKQTGSFYTPREIVNYMVDESLIAYLKNAIADWEGMDEESIDQALHELTSFENTVPFEDNPSLQKEIITALSSCTILDPACGSGAFPMGILQKMVHILQKLDPENKIWKEVQLEKAEQESKAAFEIEDKQARGERLQEINEAFDQSINDPDYARKLFLIENCIYGVDIQPIATQISKLRFFISLVVEQKVNSDKDNFGIRPLPNLETKFVAANTLIGIEKPSTQTNLFDSQELKDLEGQLKKVRGKLFSARTKDTKLKYRDLDKSLREQIATKLKSHGWQKASAEKLAAWDPYDQNASSLFFDPEWMFDIKDGFDIVIGNPPYLRVQGIRESNSEFADWLSDNYESATGSYDLYAIFTERGVQLLSKNGIVNYIMPVKWTNAAFGKGLRRFLLKKKALSKIISFDEFQVFNASTYTGIQFFQANSKNLIYNQLNTDLFTDRALNNYLASLRSIDFNSYDLEDFNDEVFTLTDNKAGLILDEISKHPITLGDLFEKIFQGIATSKDSVYFLTNCSFENDLVRGFSKELGEYVFIEKGITKPLIKGDQVHKYEKLNTSNIVVFPYQSLNGRMELIQENSMKMDFPLAYKYFKTFETVLRNRENGRFDIDSEWFQFGRKQGISNGGISKLLAPDVSLGGNFSIDLSGEYYSTTTVYGYIKKSNTKGSYWYFAGLLNSQVLWWYLKNTGAVMANGYFRFKPDYLKPFKIPLGKVEDELELLSFCLYFTEKSSDSFTLLLKVSNALVFNLYFPDHMKERGIDVLEFVERDIDEVMQGREFEKLSDAEKEQVIDQLHAKWSDSENEVVKRMAMFKEKSPEILKVILES